MKVIFSKWPFSNNFLGLKIYRNNMHTAGTGTERTTVFLFIFGMIACLRYRVLYIIGTHACFHICQARQGQHIHTEYKCNNFHAANLMHFKVSQFFKCLFLSQHCCIVLHLIYLIQVFIHLFQYIKILFQPVRFTLGPGIFFFY